MAGIRRKTRKSNNRCKIISQYFEEQGHFSHNEISIIISIINTKKNNQRQDKEDSSLPTLQTARFHCFLHP